MSKRPVFYLRTLLYQVGHPQHFTEREDSNVTLCRRDLLFVKGGVAVPVKALTEEDLANVEYPICQNCLRRFLDAHHNWSWGRQPDTVYVYTAKGRDFFALDEHGTVITKTYKTIKGLHAALCRRGVNIYGHVAEANYVIAFQSYKGVGVPPGSPILPETSYADYAGYDRKDLQPPF